MEEVGKGRTPLMETPSDITLQATLPFIDALEKLGILYYIGGSVASSVLGVRRFTIDADVIADIQVKHVRLLAKKLETIYYIDEDAIKDAIRHRSSFNIIYLSSMIKIDVFIPKQTPFAQQERQRIRKELVEEGIRPLYLASAEDIILSKLDWYKMGDKISTRQWNDVLGVLTEQASALDITYLRHWARNLDVADLLEMAFGEAGLQNF
jgi:hypothetical protein